MKQKKNHNGDRRAGRPRPRYLRRLRRRAPGRGADHRHRRAAARAARGGPAGMGRSRRRCFSTAEQLFALPRMADAAVIATPDRQHVAQAEAALKAGYHLLLEKPVAVDVEGCLEVLRLARKYRRHVVVCHVLRYTPFYNTIKQFIDDGRVGRWSPFRRWSRWATGTTPTATCAATGAGPMSPAP